RTAPGPTCSPRATSAAPGRRYAPRGPRPARPLPAPSPPTPCGSAYGPTAPAGRLLRRGTLSTRLVVVVRQREPTRPSAGSLSDSALRSTRPARRRARRSTHPCYGHGGDASERLGLRPAHNRPPHAYRTGATAFQVSRAS